jgi:ABC-type transport system involved in multi-copper enzyme maturation permease subunit
VSGVEDFKKFLRQAPWQLWTAQVTAILGIELKRNLFRRRSLWLYLLAASPVLLLALRAMSRHGAYWTVEDDTRLFAYIFQVFYLSLGIFFGCMGLFTWLFRGEIVQKSLHYYFLVPVRREVLVVGKFLAGLVTAGLFFGLSVLLSFSLMYAHFGSADPAYGFHGAGLGQLLAYLAVTLLACLGYGAIFVALSLFIKNPIIPGVFVFLWETFHAVLPALMQKFSMMFYLRQLCPVAVPPEGPMALFTVIVEPVPAWIAVPGLLCLSILILVVACLRVRRMEISYLAD